MKRVIVMVTAIFLVALWAGSAFADDKRFVFADQTVKDKRTGLIWTRDASLGEGHWNGAFELVKELNKKKYAGFKDCGFPARKS